jgi:hypothetical protein
MDCASVLIISLKYCCRLVDETQMGSDTQEDGLTTATPAVASPSRSRTSTYLGERNEVVVEPCYLIDEGQTQFLSDGDDAMTLSTERSRSVSTLSSTSQTSTHLGKRKASSPSAYSDISPPSQLVRTNSWLPDESDPFFGPHEGPSKTEPGDLSPISVDLSVPVIIVSVSLLRCCRLYTQPANNVHYYRGFLVIVIGPFRFSSIMLRQSWTQLRRPI